jgi:hypothetical protein
MLRTQSACKSLVRVAFQVFFSALNSSDMFSPLVPFYVDMEDVEARIRAKLRKATERLRQHIAKLSEHISILILAIIQPPFRVRV